VKQDHLSMDMNEAVTIYLGLGSNIEPRLQNLQSALNQLEQIFSGVRCSAVYETEPWGYTDQAAFLNMAVQAETSLSPEGVLQRVKSIEVSVGRKATFRWGPRVIDIDILIYGQDTIALEELTIPHAHILERAFVLAPLADLARDLLIPGTSMTVQQAAAQCPGMDGVHRKDDADV
jgi:2-amino-4-hydroxy-6-hydroxymethyldihydropteridine diphosphokinase